MDEYERFKKLMAEIKYKADHLDNKIPYDETLENLKNLFGI